MRAVWVGLVGAVLASGGAGAATSCPINRATLSVTDTGDRYAGQPVERPDLVGKTFTVGRYTERRKKHFSEPRGQMFNGGYEGYELRGTAGSIIVRRDHVDGSPSVAPVSWMSTSLPKDIRMGWGRGRPERVSVGQQVDYVYSGPLQSLALTVSSCR